MTKTMNLTKFGTPITKTQLRRQLKYNVIKMMEDKGFWCDDEGSNITFGHDAYHTDYTFWYRPSHNSIMFDNNHRCDDELESDVEKLMTGIEDEVNQMITNFCKSNNL